MTLAPAAIDDLPDFDLVDVACNDAIDKLVGVLTRDQVLVKRRDVNECSRIANGVVLVFVMYLIHTRRVVSRPLAVVEAVTKREGAFVKCCSDGHGETSC